MTRHRSALLTYIWFHVPAGEFARFVLIGVWNTFAGYAIFAALNFLLSNRFPEYGFLIASVIASFVNITIAFLGYKWFVFRTTGNYLREWLRTFSVYGVGLVVGFFLLPIVVKVLQWLFDLDHQPAIYAAALMLTLVNAVWNFLANKNFSFRRKPSVREGR